MARRGIRCDASPFGFGAIFFERGVPVTWIAGVWTQFDMDFLKAKAGDPAWQAEWELFGALVAVDTWLARLMGHPLVLMQLDATAALHAVLRSAGRTPAMNALAAEVALRMEIAGVQLLHEHVSGTLNVECDALSRIAQGKAVPKTLEGIRRDEPRTRTARFWWAQGSSASSSSTAR